MQRGRVDARIRATQHERASWKHALPAQQFNTWIRPLQVEAEGDELRVYAPNRFVLDWVNEKYLSRVLELLDEHGNGLAPVLSLLIGSKRSSAPRAAPNAPLAASASQAQAAAAPVNNSPAPVAQTPSKSSSQKNAPINEEPSRDSFDPMAGASSQQAPVRAEQRTVQVEGALKHTSYLNRTFTFENFVEGKSNQLARMALIGLPVALAGCLDAVAGKTPCK